MSYTALNSVVWQSQNFIYIRKSCQCFCDFTEGPVIRYKKDPAIRYKKNPAIRYKKDSSIRYIGSNLRVFFLKEALYKLNWSILKKIRYIGQKCLYLITAPCICKQVFGVFRNPI